MACPLSLWIVCSPTDTSLPLDLEEGRGGERIGEERGRDGRRGERMGGKRRGEEKPPCHREVSNLLSVQIPLVCNALVRLLPTPIKYVCRVVINAPKTTQEKRMG